MIEQPNSYVDEDGNIFWYLPSKDRSHWHRLDGPAIENISGTKQWWINGKRHRIDGPAIEYVNGRKEWWINGNSLNIELWLKENDIIVPYSDEDQMAILLRWG